MAKGKKKHGKKNRWSRKQSLINVRARRGSVLDDPNWRQDYIVTCKTSTPDSVLAVYHCHDVEECVQEVINWVAFYQVPSWQWIGGQVVVDGIEVGRVLANGRVIDVAGYLNVDAWEYIRNGGPRILDVGRNYFHQEVIQ